MSNMSPPSQLLRSLNVKYTLYHHHDTVLQIIKESRLRNVSNLIDLNANTTICPELSRSHRIIFSPLNQLLQFIVETDSEGNKRSEIPNSKREIDICT